MSIDTQLLFLGQSLGEYIQMFDLGETELNDLRILEHSIPPSGFNYEMYQRGCYVVSCHSAYADSAETLQQRAEQGIKNLLEMVTEYREEFVWDHVTSVAKLKQQREATIQTFMADYTDGKKSGRYVQDELDLPDPGSDSFDLVLTSYDFDEDVDVVEHVAHVNKLLGYAPEVRYFPIGDDDDEMIPEVMLQLQQAGLGVEVRGVKYHFEKGSNAMLRVWSNECKV